MWLGSYVAARQESCVWMCVCLNTKILKFSVEHNAQVTETQLSPTFGLHLSQNKNVRYTTKNYVSRAMTYLLTVVDPMCLNYSYMRKNITYTDTYTHTHWYNIAFACICLHTYNTRICMHVIYIYLYTRILHIVWLLLYCMIYKIDIT